MTVFAGRVLLEISARNTQDALEAWADLYRETHPQKYQKIVIMINFSLYLHLHRKILRTHKASAPSSCLL